MAQSNAPHRLENWGPFPTLLLFTVMLSDTDASGRRGTTADLRTTRFFVCELRMTAIYDHILTPENLIPSDLNRNKAIETDSITRRGR